MANQTKQNKTVAKPEDEDYTIGAFIVIGVIILLIVGVFLLIFNVLPFNTSGVVNCTSQSCFDKQFSQCKPTTWNAYDPSNQVTVKYKITGKVGDRCGIQFSSSSENNIVIACNLDNSKTFVEAQTLADAKPSAYQCRKV